MYARVLYAMLLSAASMPSLGDADDYAQPRLELTPAIPACTDTVVLRYVAGAESSTCAYRYSNTFGVVQTTGPHYPPRFTLSPDLAKIPPPRGQECLPVQTEYGPVCSLVSPPFGVYTVLNMAGDSTGVFAVLPRIQTLTVGGTIEAKWPKSPTQNSLVRLYRHQYGPAPLDTTTVAIDSVLAWWEYHFTVDTPGVYTIRTDHADFLPQTVSLDIPSADYSPQWGTRRDFRLIGPGVRACLSGRVFDCQLLPLPRCTVTAVVRCPCDSVVRTQEADAYGRYTFDSLPALCPDGDCAYTISAQAGACIANPDTGRFVSPSFADTHDIMLACPDCQSPSVSRTNERDGIRYVTTLQISTEQLPCEGEPGFVVRRKARLSFDCYNLGNQSVQLASDSILACASYAVASVNSLCQIALYPAPEWFKHTWGLLYRSTPYFPSPLLAADSFRIPLPSCVVDTITGCQSYKLADSVRAVVHLTGLGASVPADTLRIALSGTILAAQRYQQVHEERRTILTRIANRAFLVSGGGTVELYALDGRMVTRLPAVSARAGGDAVVALPAMRGLFVLRATNGSALEQIVVLLR